MREKISRGLVRLMGGQLILTLICAAIFYFALGMRAGLSAILGGFVYLIPSLYFALRLFKFHGVKQTKKILAAFYKGELIKIFISMLLFAVVFKFCSIVPVAFFITYVVVQTSFWFAPLILN